MFVTLSVMVATLSLLLSLCVCKKKAKLVKFTAKITPQSPKIKIKEAEKMKLENTQSMINRTELLQKSPKKEMDIKAEIQKQPFNLEIVKSNEKDSQCTEKTQYSQPESMQNVEEISENEKENFDVDKSREASSHGTLQYVQPRIRFFERAKEIEQCKPIEKQRNEYRTLIFMDEDKTLITGNIYPREVRQQDITECKIEKYDVVGYQIPEILDEYTCRDDDF